MSVQKMKLVSIIGHLDDVDDVIAKYIANSNMHLENSIEVLKNTKDLTPFSYTDNYTNKIEIVKSMLDLADMPPSTKISENFSVKKIDENLDKFSKKLVEYNEKKAELEQNISENDAILKQLQFLIGLNAPLDKLFSLQFVKVRFGRLPREKFMILSNYLEEMEAFFVDGQTDGGYVYGVYFTPEEFEEKVDNIFSSLGFERIMISGKAHETPRHSYGEFHAENQRLLKEQHNLDIHIKEYFVKYKDILCDLYNSLLMFRKIIRIKSYAAYTKDSFYIVGWMPEEDLVKFKDILNPNGQIVIIDEDVGVRDITPPTKVKNNMLYRPFRLFVDMYGVPAYNEFDPTFFLALVYTLMFGMMFGDVGHGVVLMIVGTIIYLWKRSKLGVIIAESGFMSTIFGFLYGSVFGSENILNPIWMRPMNNINNILIFTVGMGCVLIITAILLNIFNKIRNKDWGTMLFDTNGIVGLLFYLSILFIAINIFVPLQEISVNAVIIITIISLILLLLSEPLANLVNRKKELIHDSVGMFLTESSFELLEKVITFLTNTISFVRIGAFALNHAGMMAVVYIFANMTRGATSIIVLILGNVLVIGMEGLIVGIQSLRLGFYELFSRFYKGDGKEFISIRNN